MIDTLNELLPSASALHSLDAIAADLGQQHDAVDADVRESVQVVSYVRHDVIVHLVVTRICSGRLASDTALVWR